MNFNEGSKNLSFGDNKNNYNASSKRKGQWGKRLIQI